MVRPAGLSSSAGRGKLPQRNPGRDHSDPAPLRGRCGGPITTLVGQAATDQGLKRPHNEDTFSCWAPDNPEHRDRGVLLVVADGMGGSRAGEVASRMAVECLLRIYKEG